MRTPGMHAMDYKSAGDRWQVGPRKIGGIDGVGATLFFATGNVIAAVGTNDVSLHTVSTRREYAGSFIAQGIYNLKPGCVLCGPHRQVHKLSML